MGFLEAMQQMGELSKGTDSLSSFLKFPLDQEGRVIRVHLDVKDPYGDQLKVRGVNKVDLADLTRTPEMKHKYLYRDKVGANVKWGFTPIFRMGRTKKTETANQKMLFGKEKDWQKDDDAQLKKIKERVLEDYEKENYFAPGSVENIIKELPNHLEKILPDLEPGISHVMVFGAECNGAFLYPGDIPAIVKYFEQKLKENLTQSDSAGQITCALCSETKEATSNLDKVFKFATFDKVNILPGLSKKEIDHVFSICLECLGNVSAGRERVERTLSNRRIIPDINIWVIPESAVTNKVFHKLVEDLENTIEEGRIKALGERRENIFFHQLASQDGEGLIFHFLFIERSQSQEILHLLVEDVPPERLVLLEKCWQKTFKKMAGSKVEQGLNLDWALRSIYFLLHRLAGKSSSDQIVFRDLSLKIISKMLQGKPLPVQTLKKFATSRIPRLVHETPRWDEVQKTMWYAQLWVEYMNALNMEVSS